MTMNYNFNAEKATKECIQWIRDWFDKNGKDCKAIVGISGGKDSSIVAALCVEALGKDRVIGVMMPNGIQKDIDDARYLIHKLQINSYTINIENIVDKSYDQLITNNSPISRQVLINLPPRIRMSILYAVAQGNHGRVIGTGNLSENYIGYFTRWGDGAADCEPLGNLTVREVKAIGHHLHLPEYLVDKTPADGLCGFTDEQNIGFTYETLDYYLRTGEFTDKEVLQRINNLRQKNLFKQNDIPKYVPGLDVLFK